MAEEAPTLIFPGTFTCHITWKEYLIPEIGETRVDILKKFNSNCADNFLEAYLHTEACKVSQGVVILYNHFLEDYNLVMRLEYCEQGSLLDVLRLRAEANRSYFSEAELTQMYESMLTTMDQLQTARIAHRNIECSNWLVTRDGKVKLTDFGAAKLIKNEGSMDIHTIRAQTTNIRRSVVQMAKFDQLVSLNIFDEDIWALGKVFFEMMTLKVYVNLNTMQDEQLAQFITKKCQELNYSATLSSVLIKMLTDSTRPKPSVLLEQLTMDKTELAGPMQPMVVALEYDLQALDTQKKPDSSSEIESSDQPEASTNDDFHCGKCNTSMDGTQRFLSCGHDLCIQCIHSVISSNRRLECPKCKAVVSREELLGRTDLAENMKRYVLRLIEKWT